MQEIELLVSTENGSIVTNIEVIKKHIAAGLEEYKHMVFTEETKKEAKATVADLRKLKKEVNATVPYNSAGFIVFNGAISQLFSVWQYCAYSNGLAGKSIVEQGTSVSYNSSGNVLTISNNSSGNSLSLECLLFYGDFPSLTF